MIILIDRGQLKCVVHNSFLVQKNEMRKNTNLVIALSPLCSRSLISFPTSGRSRRSRARFVCFTPFDTDQCLLVNNLFATSCGLEIVYDAWPIPSPLGWRKNLIPLFQNLLNRLQQKIGINKRNLDNSLP
jgi:hypothetical protein